MRVYLDTFCTCGYHDNTWTGNWVSNKSWNLNHSCFDSKALSDVEPGFFRASIRLDCNIKCNKCHKSWNYWVKYRAFSDGSPFYKYYSCCGNELKLRFIKKSF
jgi:hypothetical protein